MLVCVCVCGGGFLCVYMCMYVLRVVSTDKILCFMNTLIIIGITPIPINSSSRHTVRKLMQGFVMVAGSDGIASGSNPWAAGVPEAVHWEVQAGHQPGQLHRLAPCASHHQQPDWQTFLALSLLLAGKRGRPLHVSDSCIFICCFVLCIHFNCCLL